MRSLTRLPTLLLLVAALAVAGCKKKPASSTLLDGGPKGNTETAPSAEVPGDPGRFGFAARLPADTEAYIGTVNLPKHIDALKKSNWSKEVDAFIADKTPVPAARDGSMTLPSPASALTKLWGKDFFLALGKGSAASLKGWSDLAAINTELQYVALMQGSLGVKAGDKQPAKVEAMFAQVLNNDDLMQRAADVISKLSVPPLMLGVETDKPDEVLKELMPDSTLKLVKEKAKVTQMTTKTSNFTIIQATFGVMLTDELKKQWLAMLPPDRPGMQSLVTQTIEAVQKKPYCLAYGSTAGHLIIAVGSEPPDLEFVTDPAKSLLGRPEMAFALPFAKNNLLAVTFALGDVLQAFQNPEPMQPIARGVLAGLKSSPMFGAMAASLEPRVKELGALEREMSNRKLNNGVSVAWWDKGLHIQTKGGMSPEGLEAKKPLKFAPLIEDASVLFGIAYHGDPELTAKARKLVEAWATLLHGASHELVKAGLGGENGPAIEKWVESDIIPNLVTFYEGTKTVFGKGVGNEHAWIIDLGGKMPPLPIFPQKDGEPLKMLRIAGLDTVADRPSIGGPWDAMQKSLNKVAGAFPLLAGSQLPDPVQSNQTGGLTTYAYQLMPDVLDLAPCVSVSDSTFMMGTSVSQHGELATRLLRSKPATDNNVARWRINFPGLRDAVKTFSTTGATPTNADEMKATMKWLSPLGEASGRMWIEAGNVRNDITFHVKDVLRFD